MLGCFAVGTCSHLVLSDRLVSILLLILFLPRNQVFGVGRILIASSQRCSLPLCFCDYHRIATNAQALPNIAIFLVFTINLFYHLEMSQLHLTFAEFSRRTLFSPFPRLLKMRSNPWRDTTTGLNHCASPQFRRFILLYGRRGVNRECDLSNCAGENDRFSYADFRSGKARAPSSSASKHRALIKIVPTERTPCSFLRGGSLQTGKTLETVPQGHSLIEHEQKDEGHRSGLITQLKERNTKLSRLTSLRTTHDR